MSAKYPLKNRNKYRAELTQMDTAIVLSYLFNENCLFKSDRNNRLANIVTIETAPNKNSTTSLMATAPSNINKRNNKIITNMVVSLFRPLEIKMFSTKVLENRNT